MSDSFALDNRSRWRAVVFDMDDTLYPERQFVLSGFRAVANWLEPRAGLPADRCLAELQSFYEAGVRGDTFDRWLTGHGFPTTWAPGMVEVYRDHEPLLDPFPGVRELLARLRLSVKLGLLSDGYLAVQRRKLAALGLADQFDAVVFSDAWGRAAWKPSTRPFLEALRLLDTPATAAIYVADNPAKDFLGARQIGMGTIWLRRPGGEYALLEPPSPAHAPDLTVASLDELESILAQSEKN